MGKIVVEVPKLGPTDIGVFQVLDFDRIFVFIPAEQSEPETATLDEVLVAGYPLSRLQGGYAIPQASRGIVRRAGKEIVELDSSIHPGLSGGPILNRSGGLVGMAVGLVDSPAYGIAVRAQHLREALDQARALVRAEQNRLAELGCDPGARDGWIGLRTWRAFRCEEAQSPPQGMED